MANFLRETTLPPPPKERLKLLENAFQIEFPSSYVEFLNLYNGDKLNNNEIKTKTGDFVLEKFLPIVSDIKSDPRGWEDVAVVATRLDWGLVESEDSVGLDLVPIAAMFAVKYLTLDYRKARYAPQVSYWDHETSSEFSPAAIPIAASFEDFVNMIGDFR